MDNQKETGVLKEEVQVVLDRLLKMKAYFETDASSFYMCKSYYHQVQSLRKRFYEILPVLKYRPKQIDKNSSTLILSRNNSQSYITAVSQKCVFQAKGLDGSPQIVVLLPPNLSLQMGSSSKEASPTKAVPSRQVIINKQSPNHSTLHKAQNAAEGTNIPSVPSESEDLNSFLKKATEEVDSLTTNIEKTFFEMEAEYKNSSMVNVAQNPEHKNLNGKITASSVVLNINGNNAVNISGSDIKMLGGFDSGPIFKPTQQSSEQEEDRKPNISQFDPNSEVTQDAPEMLNEEMKRRKELFYNRFADKVLCFNDGQTVKVSSAFLIEKSSLFENILSSSNEINLRYNSSDFILFLNCLMEFQDCSIYDALRIFPVAYELKVKILIEKCENILKPQEINENLSLILNMAVAIKCEELVGKVINFLLEKGRIFFFFNEERYYFRLSPESVEELLCHFEIDSFIVKKIVSWGENYLKQHNEAIDLKVFLTKHRIMEKLAVACFETMGVKF